MGVIKGSEQTLLNSEGVLSREQYETLGERTNPTFASCRAKVYTLFQSYMKKKGRASLRDAPERLVLPFLVICRPH